MHTKKDHPPILWKRTRAVHRLGCGGQVVNYFGNSKFVLLSCALQAIDVHLHVLLWLDPGAYDPRRCCVSDRPATQVWDIWHHPLASVSCGHSTS
eukprot:5338874-Amphidinium_carterae.1